MMTKICNWARRLRYKLRWSTATQSATAVPKGHLAVYVGKNDEEPRRYLVPVIYFNHPLFEELLREAEEVFGFHHAGNITIPCRKVKFESVQLKIAGRTHYNQQIHCL